MCSRVSVKCVCVLVCIWCASNLWIELIHYRLFASLRRLFSLYILSMYYCLYAIFAVYYATSHYFRSVSVCRILLVLCSPCKLYFYPGANRATLRFYSNIVGILTFRQVCVVPCVCTLRFIVFFPFASRTWYSLTTWKKYRQFHCRVWWIYCSVLCFFLSRLNVFWMLNVRGFSWRFRKSK